MKEHLKTMHAHPTAAAAVNINRKHKYIQLQLKKVEAASLVSAITETDNSKKDCLHSQLKQKCVLDI